MKVSETGRSEWIDVPGTKGRAVALRVVLIAICLIAASFIVHACLLVPAEVPQLALVSNL
jgi:hypothetical protein